MKPAPFEYAAPHSLDEAIELVREHGDEAKVLAGGQSLGPLLNLRLATPAVLVDLGRIPDLRFEEEGSDGSLRMGAMTTLRAIEGSRRVATGWPLLTESIRWVAHPPIRNRGTIGGTLSHADPAAELPATSIALNATIVVEGPAGRRSIPARDFFITYLTPALEADEIVVEVQYPPVGPGSGWAWLEFAPRAGDFAIVGLAALVSSDEDGRITDAEATIAGVADRPLDVSTVVRDLILGREVGDRTWHDEVIDAVDAHIDPPSDLMASASYRRRLVRHLTGEAFVSACNRVEVAR